MIAGWLFARAGLRTLVVEKHRDFLRDFRGDTVHPSTLAIFAELGRLEDLLRLPHQKMYQLGARIAGQKLDLVDFSHLDVPAPYIAMMPQWDLLDFIADEAGRYAEFELRQGCAATGLIVGNGRVEGLTLSDGSAARARLTIAADGRHSILRTAAGLPLKELGAPMDVFWYRLPKAASGSGASQTLGVFEAGRIVIFIDRGEYFQSAFVFPKGRAEEVKKEGIDLFREQVRAAATGAMDVDALKSWDDVKLLTVAVDRLDKWWRPGLLIIGDAAHAMSPIGGVGINLAIQDAVAAANILAAPMALGADPDPLLQQVQDRRLPPARWTQRLQLVLQNRVIAPLLEGHAKLDRPPLPALLLHLVPALRRLPARIFGLGFRPEHVRSPGR